MSHTMSIMKASNVLLRRIWLCTLLTPIGTVACSELTSVDTRDVVALSDMENRAGARALRAGAILSFVEAYAGPSSSQTLLSGRISDELVATHANDQFDRREIPEFTTVLDAGGGHRNLSRARVDLLEAITAMQRFDSGSRSDIAELFSLLAYTELFFGENFCSGVPLSSIVDGKPVYGEQRSAIQMLERAVADFDSAVVYSGTEAHNLNLARVGRARTLLQLGDFAAAAATVEDVPTDFSYITSHAATQPNGLWQVLWSSRSATIANREGGNGVDFVSAQDPRVETVLLPLPGLDGQSPVYAPVKYSSSTSPVVLASGVEASLIEAEALLQADDAAGALAALNTLRARLPGLDPLPLESSEEARVDQLFRERAFWLFGTGHRHGDLRRLVKQYGRDTEAVFPTGEYRPGTGDGRTYGRDVTFDLHILEQSNPNFTGCFDRNP